MPPYFRVFLVLIVLSFGFGVAAQTPTLLPDEPDSAAFIESTFDLQSSYASVRCVSSDASCPPNITIAPPCFTAVCDGAEQTYPTTETYADIQAAADAAQPGDLIVITPGHYAGVVLENTGGADGAYIHFLGLGALGDVVIDRVANPELSWLRHHFYFINTHHYILQNLTFTGSEEGAGIFFSGYFSETGSFSHHMIVSGVYSHDNYSWGMHTTAASQLLIQDSVFTNSADEHGLYVSGSGDDILIRRNVFQGNNAAGVQVNPDPQTAVSELFYWILNTTGETCGWTESDVEFTGAAEWDDIKRCYDEQGLPDLGAYIEDGIGERLIIEQNIITGNGSAGGAGINLASVRHSVVRSNLIYGNGAAGIACWDNAYAEEKGLASSQFGCQYVVFANNTIVDEGGSRGALILNRDARDLLVYNNIIVRDRYDAYEIAENAGNGLRSGANYYFAQSVTDAPGFGGEEGSITGFSIDEALAQFVRPSFDAWIIPAGDGYQLNPDRPDFHPRVGSALAAGANDAYVPTLDLFGTPYGSEIGALAVSSETVTVTQAEPTAAPAAMRGSVVFSLNGQAHMIRDGELINLSAALDPISPGEDGFINISPDGEWLIFDTTRFDPACADWSCWAVMRADLSDPAVIYVEGQPLHADGAAAVLSGGNAAVVETDMGDNDIDLIVIARGDSGWYWQHVLSSGSGYPFNRQPAVSADGSRVLFDCMIEPYGGIGGSICEAGIAGESLREVMPPDTAAGFIHHADYAPDGTIIFEAAWAGEQLWALDPGSSTPRLIAADFHNDNTPCVLADGSIVSLWLNRPNSAGIHEIKWMTADGAQSLMLLIDQDVTDIGMGCGDS